MAETPLHWRNLMNLICMLESWFADDPQVYVAGNMFVYYAPGDRLKHLSPDVFVVRGISKVKPRDYYLTWEEGQSPQFVIEVTSRSTKEEDIDDKLWLYRDVLKVNEYFLFDPYGEYLDPPLMGYRLNDGVYVPITPVEGRLPSEVVGLHLEAAGSFLRLHDPMRKAWILTPTERAQAEAERAQVEAERAQVEAQRAQAEAQRAQAEAERAQVEAQRAQAEAQRAQVEAERAQVEASRADFEQRRAETAEAEIERLKAEITALRRQTTEGP